MASESVKAIQLSGINHNADKINSEDGMCEDIVNIRFRDGSWRTTGEGKKVFSFEDNTGGQVYKNLFIHVNSYRHLLGTTVRTKTYTVEVDGEEVERAENIAVVEWFANIDNDGVFEALDTPKQLYEVKSDTKVIYAQGGHLLVIINERSRVTLFFNSVKGEYSVQEEVDANAETKHPLGRIEYKVAGRKENGRQVMLYKYSAACAEDGAQSYTKYDGTKGYSKSVYNQLITRMYKEDCYCGPFLVCLAVRTVTGTWTLASAPTLVHPSFHGDEMHTHKSVYESFVMYNKKLNLRKVTENPLYVITNGQMRDPQKMEGTDDFYKAKYVHSNRYSQFGPVRASGVSEDISNDDLVFTLSRGDVYNDSGAEVDIPASIIHIDEIPTIGDCWTGKNITPADYDGSKNQDHIVWGKMNDLWVSVKDFDISSQQELYDKIGVFISPVIGANDSTGQLLLGETDKIGVDENGEVDDTDVSGSKKYFKYNFQTAYSNNILPAKKYLGTDGNWHTAGEGFSTTMSRFSPKRTFRYDEPDDADSRDYIAKQSFYAIRTYDISEFRELVEDANKDGDGWFKVSFESGKHPLVSLQGNDRLPKDAFTSSTFRSAAYAMMFNGRLHLANYKEDPGTPWGMQPFEERDHSTGGILTLTENGLNLSADMSTPNAIGSDVSFDDFCSFVSSFNKQRGNYASFSVSQLYQMKNFDGDSLVIKENETNAVTIGYRLPLFVPYPNTEVSTLQWFKNMMDVVSATDSSNERYYSKTLDYNTDHSSMLYYPIKFAFEFPQNVASEDKYVDDRSFDLTSGTIAIPDSLFSDVNYESQDRPNGLRVSEVDLPTVFTDENKYRVGQTEIVAIAANAMPVGQGQTGAVPLFVFTKDGVYGLFVDSSGEMAYTGSRILSRDIISDADSAKATDAGVVFTTERGLMCMAGNEAEEIGQDVEGDWCKYSKKVNGNIEYDKFADVGYHVSKLASLPSDSDVAMDFLEYIQHCIVDYNHNERELMVSSTMKYRYTDDASKEGVRSGSVQYTTDEDKDGKHVYGYTYIMDRSGEWSRRNVSADEYFSSFPSEYRLHDGVIYQIDKNCDDDNGMFIITREIKLDSIGFKSIDRVVARGYFETFGDTDSGRKYGNESGRYLRLMVYGSYDGRKWSLLGGNEKTGKFTDFGCVVSHPDIRYVRFLLCGAMSKDSRFDYFEVSCKQSKLSNKIR